MSIFTNKIELEHCHVILKPKSVIVTYQESSFPGSYGGIEFNTPAEAHN